MKHNGITQTEMTTEDLLEERRQLLAQRREIIHEINLMLRRVRKILGKVGAK